MRSICLAVLLVFSTISHAQLVPWTDYELSTAVHEVTTIKVDSNMGETYLEGLAKTWVSSMEALVKLDQIESYSIYWSDLPESGEFNLMLIIVFANNEDLEPNKAKYEAFVKELTQDKFDEGNEFAQENYPAMREITGQYLFREVTLLK